jgi:Acetyltransferase (GNAT) family
MARALAENADITVVDEFTSVVDRTVAKIGSAAISKAVKRHNKKFVAVSCHDDIIDWLEPDWTYSTMTNQFVRGRLRRPSITLTIQKVDRKAWELFSRYHYLSSNLNSSAQCFAAFIEGKPVAFAAVIHFPHPVHSNWREHRLVCLPEYQGVGVGNALSNFVASLYSCHKPYKSVTGNPALIKSRAKSKFWKMTAVPKIENTSIKKSTTGHGKTIASNRYTASFLWIGTKDYENAKQFGVIKA